MSERWPVTVAVSRPDGTVEHVRVGIATRTTEGFSISLELQVRTQEAARGSTAPREPTGRRQAGAAPSTDMVFPNYGRSKGMPIAGASTQDLEFYASGARRTLADPGKARFHDKERVLLAAIEAELARQRGEDPPPPGDDDAPPPGDEDAPF